MATKMDTPMLSVNPCKMSSIDTRNVGSLAGVWGVFHKCAQSLEDGRRLENMSWRLLSRQTLCSDTNTSSSPHSYPQPPLSLSRQIPQSSQLHTAVAGRSLEPFDNTILSSSPQQIEVTAPAKPKMLPVLSLEKMVSSIQEKQGLEPLSPSITDAVPKVLSYSSTSDVSSQLPPPTFSHASHRSSESSTSTAASEYESERSTRPSVGSDTSAEILSTSNMSNVIRGFSPSNAPSSYRSSAHLAAPSEAPSKSLGRIRPDTNKKNPVFSLGGSSGEEESSFEDRMQSQPHQSSLTAGLKKPMSGKKTPSFRDIVESRKGAGIKSHEDEEVFEDSDDEDDVSDSAIDDSEDEVDEEEEDWEDDASETADDTDKPLFQRVDSKPNLVSRRSLLTTMMTQEDRASAFQEMAINTSGLKRSKTSSNVPTSEETKPTSSNGLTVPPKPIMRTKSDLMSLVSSPKTTRRNMLSTEINEDLRKSILHERLQKKSTVNAYSKRVQSARNLTTLYVQPEHRERESTRDDYDYYGQGIGAYHQAGW